ncbi:SDR family NAD(P)-dependent oxidoreductase [Bradyrhizobium sp. CCBAU 51627]|uniref:SDR family NAD(P)-dependent oxidoreductase n=1 Tax=Bradyrhizobium sp. CCBAU 51627 TaxID=1325088 RepID=UPI0023052BFC|nr:SDR family oxidoreductase [Bradyrhizobium sp. CCBAU 51627]MDA9432120.1 acetoin dehydrogenase [Bradyrhizobium sp. CCBAU 51627]
MTAIRGAAAITGAASGIGRALAIELAQRRCELALADRDEAGLNSLAAEIGAQHKVSVHRVDVGEAADIALCAREAVAAHPALNILVNNAGVALMGTFEEIDQAQMDRLFDSIACSSRTGVGVTDNARRAQMIDRFEAAARTTPKEAALRIIRGIERNEPRILIGNDARFMDILQRFRPGSYWAPLQRRLEKMAKGT